MSTNWMPTPALDIVRVLQEYGNVPSDFIAKVLARNQNDVRDVLVELETRGVVQVVNDRVGLAPDKWESSKN